MSNTLTIQIIKEARDLLANPENWTQFELAATVDDESCQPWQPEAAKFCAYGALLKCAHDLCGDLAIAHHFVDSALTDIFGDKADTDQLSTTIFQVNDREGRKAVLELFDKALAAQ